MSVGDSKSGAVLNESAPDVELMLNLPPSLPLSTNQESVVGMSTSVAANVRTAVEFSFTEAVVALVVITGASLTLVTLTVIVCVSLSDPSETFTVTT